ncbi:DNA-binding transcriptional LysR family regulator [Stella humosa]|uniref:DNA-binding transcriptional LysR family regulator n=2 Tax=Stella humosa TaxID=94 RepID=A0A3N1M1V8_9PROT|nr:DNA-binding transcriptional LysR family regulator [Stella humosa]BBK31072.1 LysR family transcriptional regulator [Stella humosa]
MRSLEAFRHVFETGSVTRAAERLGVSQPAISQTIFALEKAVAVKLFERAGARRLAPTPEARLIYPACCGVLDALDRFELAARDAHSGGRVTIGAMPSIAMGMAQEAIDRLRVEYPLIHVHLDPRYSGNLEALLVSGELDIAIGSEAGTSDRVESELLTTLPVVVVVPRGHRLAGRPSLAPGDLEGEPLLCVHRQAPYRAAIDAAFAAAGQPLTPTVEAPGFALCDFVVRGQGIGLMSAISAWRCRHREIDIVPLAPDIGCGLYMMRRRGAELHPFCAAFRTEIVRLAQEIMAVVPMPTPAVPAARRRPRGGLRAVAER